MGLRKYQKKRSFSKTPEPSGKKTTLKGSGQLRFVVQKHAASHLHYDFRLEMGGVLKSWAVPKGPVMNPNIKRLAVQVEDHPLDYIDFHGRIPKGNYGAGTVEIWDHGTYADASEEQELLKALKKGHLHVELKGKRLKGGFGLTHFGKEPNTWLMIKKKAGGRGQEAGGLEKRTKLSSISTSPMLASIAEKPFDRKDWFFELKFDGYRAIAVCEGKKVHLYSRNGKLFNSKYPEVVKALQKMNLRAVIDGEIVVLDEKGRSTFEGLQMYEDAKGELVFYVFDVLARNGRDLRREPLRDRKKILETLMSATSGTIRYSEHVEEKGKALFKEIVKRGLEGIVAKDATSTYQSGVRGHDWLKIKSHKRQEAVIAGFTEPRGSRTDLGALVLGVYKRGVLTYIGHTGGRLGNLRELRKKLEKIEIPNAPFVEVPKTNAPVHWVKPKYIAEISFQEWTSAGHMRQPIFFGLREDKSPTDVHEETAKAQHTDEHAATVTNAEKVYWPKENYTKGDMIAYYREIAPLMLPYLKDRPEILHRYPNGIEGEAFYQHDLGPKIPEGRSFKNLFSRSAHRKVNYALCQTPDDLQYLANLGCIEINPWHSRVQELESPDYLVLDLDPEHADFSLVIKTALAAHKVLQKAGIESFPKTSGKRGLHIYIPLAARYSYEETKAFAELLAWVIHEQVPEITSLERLTKKRQGKVYIDYLRNEQGQSLVAAYSVRPWPGATVSAPLEWKEVNSKLDPSKFTIKTMLKRVEKKGDLWKGVMGKGVDLAKAMRKLG